MSVLSPALPGGKWKDKGKEIACKRERERQMAMRRSTERNTYYPDSSTFRVIAA